MFKISNSNILSIITKLMVLLVISKSIALSLWWYLPSSGVDLQIHDSYKPQYQRVNFKNMIERTVVKKELYKPVVKKPSNGISITNMILKGLYGNGQSGMVILALKSSPKKTSIIAVGENFSGYILDTILINSVIFTKNSKEYILKIELEDSIKKRNHSFVKHIKSATYQDEEKRVSRADIKYYARNPNKIWRDISIVQMKNNQGFKITNVRRNSKMAKLGLKKGDIMIKANNNNLKSYKDAINLYKNIDKLQTVQLVVLRNNQEKEFIYEIN